MKLVDPLGQTIKKSRAIRIVPEQQRSRDVPVTHHPTGDVVNRSWILNAQKSCHGRNMTSRMTSCKLNSQGLTPLLDASMHSLCTCFRGKHRRLRDGHLIRDQHDQRITMKGTTMNLNLRLLTLIAFGAAGAAAAQSPSTTLMESRYLAARVVAGETSLDGPAVTGPESVGEIDGEDSESGVGLQLETGYALDHGLFLRGLVEWVGYGDDPSFDMARASLGLGLRHDLGRLAGADWYAYGILSAEYARSSGLSEYGNNPTFGGLGDGKSGDDVGLGLEGGVAARFAARWEASLYAKYYEFFDGAGPGFGARVEYALTDAWRLQGSWDGLWVEDAGYNIDLDTQRFTFGAAYRY
jgi:hypothetical protein